MTRLRYGLAAATAALALAAVGTPAMAAPTNPNNCVGGLKIESPADGTYRFGSVRIIIDVRSTSKGPVFDYRANTTFSSVRVKGGPGAILYGGGASGTGLHAPVNPNNGKYYGLSHICFSGGKKAPSPKGGKR